VVIDEAPGQILALAVEMVEVMELVVLWRLMLLVVVVTKQWRF